MPSTEEFTTIGVLIEENARIVDGRLSNAYSLAVIVCAALGGTEKFTADQRAALARFVVEQPCR